MKVLWIAAIEKDQIKICIDSTLFNFRYVTLMTTNPQIHDKFTSN